MKKTVLGRIAAVALSAAAVVGGAGALAVGLTATPTIAYASWTYTDGMDVRDCPVWRDAQTGAEYYRLPAGNYSVSGELTKGIMLAPSDPNYSASGERITLRIKGEVVYNYQGAAPESTYMIDFYNNNDCPITIVGSENATVKLQNGAGFVYNDGFGDGSGGTAIKPTTTIKNITFDGNNVPADNLIYFDDSAGCARNLTIQNCTFMNFKADFAGEEYSPFHAPVQIKGGAASAKSGTGAPIPATVNIADCTFKNNEGRFGGALVLRGTRSQESSQTMNAYVTGCTFENNSAVGEMGGRIELAGTEQCVSGGSIAATSGTHVFVSNTTITGGKVEWETNAGNPKNCFAGGIALESRYAGVPAYCELANVSISGCEGYGVSCHRGEYSAFGNYSDYGWYGQDNVGLKLCGGTTVTDNYMGVAAANVFLNRAARGFYTLGLADDFSGMAGISVDFSEGETKWISQGVTDAGLLEHIKADDPTRPIKLDGDRIRMDVHEHAWKCTSAVDDGGNTVLTIWCENEGCKHFSTDGVPAEGAATSAATVKIVPNKTKYDQKAIDYKLYVDGKETTVENSGLPLTLSVDLYKAPESGVTSGGVLAEEGAADAGDYYFDATAAIGGAELRWQLPFSVARKPLSECYARIDDPRPWYDGEEHTLPSSYIHIYFGTSTRDPELEQGVDYTYEGELTAMSCGDHLITMTGQGNYTGTATDSWSIFTKNATPVLKLNSLEVDYDGEQHTLESVKGAPASDESYKKMVTMVTYGIENADGTIAWGETVRRIGNQLVTLEDSLGDAGSFRDAGTYTIWVKAQNPGYYPPDPVKATLTIKPRALTLEVTNATRTYGDENPEFTYNIASGEVVEGDDLQVSVTSKAERLSDHGEYPFIAMLTGEDAVNYTVSVSDKLAIEKRPVSITWDNLELPYNGREQVPTGTVSNVAEGDSLVATVYGGGYERVGTYTRWTYLSGTRSSNYEIAEADQKVTYSIVKAHLSVPTGITSKATSAYGKPDGALYGVLGIMEWRAEGSDEWSTDWPHNLAAGTYYVRFRDCESCYQSEAAEVVVENGPKIAVNLPSEDEQVGYTITADPAEVEWGGSTTLHISFKGEFGKLSNFSVRVDGVDIPVDDDGINYSIYGIKRAVTITVEGVGDATPPQATATLGEVSWTKVQTGLDFESIVVGVPAKVALEAHDGSGVASIEYIDSVIELSESELKCSGDWTVCDGKVEISAEGQHVVYFKVSDVGGNTVYLSTAGFTVDATAPIIQLADGSAVSNGDEFCVEAALKVTDDHDASPIVTDNGEAVELDQDGTFKLGAGRHSLLAKDAAGNESALELTVKAEHNFEWALTSYPAVGDGERGLPGAMQQVCRDCDYRGEEAEIPGLTAIGYKGTYDGEEHVGIALPDLPAGSEVMYGTDSVDEKPFSPNDAPKFKNAGDYMVYVKIKLPYFEGMYITGSVEVSIEKRELLAEWGASTLVWNGELQAPDATPKNAVPGDDVAFSVDGRQRDVNEDGEVYTASIGGLAGKDAGNYRLPSENVTCSFRIVRAGSDAPNVSATDETIRGKHDGSIEGVEAGMEWRATDAEDWIPASGSAVIGLAPGSYEVRRAATATHKASDPAAVVVNAGRMLTVKLPAERKGYTLTCEKTELSWLETAKLEVRLAAGYSMASDFAVKVNGDQIDPELEGGFTLVGTGDLAVTVEGVADVTPPTIEGIEDGKTYCGPVSFAVADTAAGELSVLDGGAALAPGEDGAYSLGAGEHHIAVADAAGNKTQVSVVVNADHVAEDGWKSDGASHWHVCKFCGEAIDRADHELAWVTDELPTVDKPGSRYQECGVCGWRGASEQVSYISATGYEGVYDGLQHGIALAELPEGASVEYSLDGESFSSEAPQFKDVCDATVHYRVSLPEVGVVEGSAQVKITPREVGATWGETVFAWDGREHVPSANATGVLDGDDVSLEVAGAQADVNEGGDAYVATVSGLSGASAGNYCLPNGALTCEFFIRRAEAAVPSVSGANESVKGKADGRLTGLSAGMEWRVAGADSWTAAQGDVDDLEPGEYEVRWAATDTHNASPAAKVTIAEGRLLKVTLPATQTGYTLTADKTEAAWREEITLSFSLLGGYSRTDEFALEVNGQAAELGAEGRIVVAATEDLVVSVKGVADLDKPVISGIENGGVYCLSATFTVSDTADGALTVRDGEKEMTPESDGTYRLGPGTHVVSVSDAAGNVTTKTVTVNAAHTADADGWHSDTGGHWRVCTCGEVFDRGGHDLVWVVDRAATNKEVGKKHEECATCGYKGATVEIPLVAPKIVEGAGQTIEADAGSDLSVRSDADLDDFLGVKVDGAELDADSYEVASGSTVVTLKAAYLQTLAVGTHELEVVSKNGAAATTFTIKAKEVVPEPEPTPTPSPDPEPTPEPDPDSDPDSTSKPSTEPATETKPSTSDDSKKSDKKTSESAPADNPKSKAAVPEAGDASAPALLTALAGVASLVAARRRRS